MAAIGYSVAGEKLIREENLKSKISCQTPFKVEFKVIEYDERFPRVCEELRLYAYIA